MSEKRFKAITAGGKILVFRGEDPKPLLELPENEAMEFAELLCRELSVTKFDGMFEELHEQN